MSAGVVDLADYGYWKAHFGEVAPGAGSGSADLAPGDSHGANLAAVPEPASLSLAVFAVLVCWTLRRAGVC